MKTRFAIALTGLFLIPAVHADHHMGMPSDPMGKDRGMMMDCPMLDKPGMMTELGLSDTQKQKVQAIHEEAMKKHDALREETHKKVVSVLTPEQAKKLEARRKQMMEQKSDRMEKRAEHMEMRADKMKKRADQMKEQAKEPAKTY